MQSLDRQNYHRIEVVVLRDWDGVGAPIVRNRGLALARGRYVVWSDADVRWDQEAMSWLPDALQEPRMDHCGRWVGYAYGAYEKSGQVYFRQEFDAELLRRQNFISTMAMIDRQVVDVLPPWDGRIRRLQDWDYWLTLLEQGFSGVYVPYPIPMFKTWQRGGITFGPEAVPWEQAEEMVKKKHGL